MTNSVDGWAARVVGTLSGAMLLYVACCQINMNAPSLYRDQAFLLYLSGAARRSPVAPYPIWPPPHLH